MDNERALQAMFRSMNAHVPSQRPSLESLLQMDDPHYVGRDGKVFKVSKEEITNLATYIQSWDWSRLKIPILLLTDTQGEGTWKVSGKVEVELISKIIGREPESENEIYIFYPHMMELRKRFPTTTNVFYMP